MHISGQEAVAPGSGFSSYNNNKRKNSMCKYVWVLEHSEEGDQEGTAHRQSLAHEIMEAGTQCIL